MNVNVIIKGLTSFGVDGEKSLRVSTRYIESQMAIGCFISVHCLDNKNGPIGRTIFLNFCIIYRFHRLWEVVIDIVDGNVDLDNSGTRDTAAILSVNGEPVWGRGFTVKDLCGTDHTCKGKEKCIYWCDIFKDYICGLIQKLMDQCNRVKLLIWGANGYISVIET